MTGIIRHTDLVNNGGIPWTKKKILTMDFDQAVKPVETIMGLGD